MKIEDSSPTNTPAPSQPTPSTSTSFASTNSEPQPGPSGVNTRKFAQTTTHDIKPTISVDDDDSDSDVEYHSSYQRSPQPSTSKMVSPIRIKLHPRNPSKNTVLTAPDLQLNWDSSSDSNSSDDVVILPNENITLPIDLTNDSDSDEDMLKPNLNFKRRFSTVVAPAQSNQSTPSTPSTSTIESANPRDAIPPSVFE